MLFGDERPTYEPPAEQDEPFSLTDETTPKRAMVNVRTRQQVFRFQVLQRYGSKCAVCSITHPSLVKAAHIREKRSKKGQTIGVTVCRCAQPTMMRTTPICSRLILTRYPL